MTSTVYFFLLSLLFTNKYLKFRISSQPDCLWLKKKNRQGQPGYTTEVFLLEIRLEGFSFLYRQNRLRL